MLNDVIGNLLPSALAVALSPIPIIATRARPGLCSSPNFGAGFRGWLDRGPTHGQHRCGAHRGRRREVAWQRRRHLQVAIGVLLLVMAAKQWNKRPKDGQQPAGRAWMATFDTAPPLKAAGLGALLSGPISTTWHSPLPRPHPSPVPGGLDSAQKGGAIAAYVVLGSVTVAGPVIFYLLDAERAAPPLNAIRQFMSDNNAVIMMVVLLLLGAKLLGDGLAVI